MTTLLLPLEMHGPHGFDEGLSILPFFGGFLLLLVLLAGLAGLYLWRQGKLTLPGLTTRRSPEEGAKQILADRFARGDISTDEFMERSSILNWTPGSDATAPGRPRKKRR
jgi:putative membrane protein